MGLSMRQAYEKSRTPLLTVRRGRDPDIPVSLYQELDELTRRVDGLVLLGGTNAEAISKILKAEDPATAAMPTTTPSTPPTTGTTTPKTFTRTIVNFAESGSGGNVATPYVLISSEFIFGGALFVFSSTASARIHVDYKPLTQATGSDISKAVLNIDFTAGVPVVVVPGSLGYNETAIFAAGSLRLRVTFASTAGVLSGVGDITLIHTVGG